MCGLGGTNYTICPHGQSYSGTKKPTLQLQAADLFKVIFPGGNKTHAALSQTGIQRFKKDDLVE